MNRILTTKFSVTDRKAAIVLTLLVMAFVLLTLTQDIIRSGLKNSAFYFSESFIFSSFWWLFAPLLFMQYFAVKQKKSEQLAFQAALIILPIFLHLFAFPFLVWALSAAFYYHTYSFQQTLKYILAEHLCLLLLFYSIPVLAFQFFTKKANSTQPISEIKNETDTTQFISTLFVTDRNKKTSIAVSEILYFSANPPYINIHLDGNKYLHTETLKSVSIKLNPEQFVRVHKSTIINIKMVVSYTSRLNGDYDLTMKNNMQVRVSRNFADDFKKLFNKANRLKTK